LAERLTEADAICDAFRKGGAVVVDLRPLAGKGRRGSTFGEGLEAARAGLVAAMKAGVPLVIDLGQKCPPFAQKIWKNPKHKV